MNFRIKKQASEREARLQEQADRRKARLQEQADRREARLQEQVERRARLKEKLAEQRRKANQRTRASLNRTINKLEGKINDRRKTIEEIDNKTYSKHNVLAYDGKELYFNGKYFTNRRNGERLNEQESEEAWAVMRRAMQKNMNSLQGTKAKLENRIATKYSDK